MVAERRPLGEARGAAGELDVDGIVELQHVRERLQPVALGRAREPRYLGEVVHAGRGLRPEAHHRLQMRQLLGLQSAGPRVVELRREPAQHLDVAARLEGFGGDQRAALDLVQRVFELRQAIGGVDVDQDQPGLRRGELRHRPFAVVGRPDTDAVARLQAERKQACGERVDLLRERAVAPAHVLMRHHQRLVVGEARGGPVELRADGEAEQRLRARTAHVAHALRRHRPSLPRPGCPPLRTGSAGAQGRNRTTDTRIFSPLLYQLSYLGLGRHAGLCIGHGAAAVYAPGAVANRFKRRGTARRRRRRSRAAGARRRAVPAGCPRASSRSRGR